MSTREQGAFELKQPCECGSQDAYWHGDTMRVYCCDPCWALRTKVPECCAKSKQSGAVRVYRWMDDGEHWIDVCADKDGAEMTLVLPSGKHQVVNIKNCPYCGVYLGGQTCVEFKEK